MLEGKVTMDSNKSPNRSRARQFLVGLVLVSCSVFLAVVLFEVALRIIAPSDLIWQRHEILGHSHKPGKKGVYRKMGLMTRFSFNSEGWRDREYSIEKPEGTFRIIVIGDSFIEGIQFPVEEILTELLEARLNREHTRPFEVINMGVGAFGTDQEYLALKHYGSRYDPDLVLLAFCVDNDIYGNLLEFRGEPLKPYFYFDESGDLVQREFRLPKSEKCKAFFRDRFQLYMFLKNRLSKMNWISVFLMRLGILHDSNSIQRDEHGILIDYYTHQAVYPPAWEKAWEVTKALLLAIRDETSRMHADLLLVQINYDLLVHDELWQKAIETYPVMNEVEWDLGKANRMVSEFCETNRIESIDLLPHFREKAARTGEALYLPVEGHWNRKGHQLAEELIYNKIRDAGLIPTEG